MNKYVVYGEHGEILRRFEGDATGAFLTEGESLLQVESFEGLGWGTHYVDSGAVVRIPTKPCDGYEFSYVFKRWIAIDLQAAKDDRSKAMSAACKAEIISGFESSALGGRYHYPAKETDQANLSGSVLASMLPGVDETWTTPFWCSDSNGIWQFRIHSALQIQQVGRDAKAAILASMGKNEMLQAQIAAAQTILDVESISW